MRGEQEEGAHRHNHDYSLPFCLYILMVKNAQAHLRRAETLFLLSVQFHARNRLNLPAAFAYMAIKQLMCVTCAPLHIINTICKMCSICSQAAANLSFSCVRAQGRLDDRRVKKRTLLIRPGFNMHTLERLLICTHLQRGCRCLIVFYNKRLAFIALASKSAH